MVRPERYAASYPSGDRARSVDFRLGNLYAFQQEFGRAIEAYERLPALSPDDIDSPAALFKAASIRSATGDHHGAACDCAPYFAEFVANSSRRQRMATSPPPKLTT